MVIRAVQEVGALKKAEDEATEATADWSEETFRATQLNIEEFMLGAARSAGILASEQSDLERETERTNAAIKRQIDRMFALESAQLELAGGLLGLIEAGRTYREAQAEVNQLERQGKQGTKEYADAVSDLLSNKLQLEQQAIEFITTTAEEYSSLQDAKQALTDYGLGAGLSKQALKNFISAVLEATGMLDDLNRRLDKLNGKRMVRPTRVSTRTAAAAAAEAAASWCERLT